MGTTPRMVLVVNIFLSFRHFFSCFLVAIFDLVHDVEATTVQFHGHHSHFRKYFQMLLAVKEGEI